MQRRLIVLLNFVVLFFAFADEHRLNKKSVANDESDGTITATEQSAGISLLPKKLTYKVTILDPDLNKIFNDSYATRGGTSFAFQDGKLLATRPPLPDRTKAYCTLEVSAEEEVFVTTIDTTKENVPQRQFWHFTSLLAANCQKGVSYQGINEAPDATLIFFVDKKISFPGESKEIRKVEKFWFRCDAAGNSLNPRNEKPITQADIDQAVGKFLKVDVIN